MKEEDFLIVKLIKQIIKDQFNLLRIVDNSRYPAFFIHKNKKYVLKISRMNNNFSDILIASLFGIGYEKNNNAEIIGGLIKLR